MLVVTSTETSSRRPASRRSRRSARAAASRYRTEPCGRRRRVHAREPRAVRRGGLPEHAGDLLTTPSRRRSRTYFRGRRRLPRRRLGDRDRARLARSSPTCSAPARPGGPTVQAGTIKVADRVHDASKDLPRVLGADGRLVQLHLQRPRRSATCWPPSSRSPFEIQPRAARSTASPAARWAPTIRSPGARTSGAAARSTPRSATRPRASARPTSATHLGGAIKWAAGKSDPVYSDCGATVLGQLPADQDQRARRT